ncbi:MAG: phosphoribosylanthranilate isomerase [Gammaproteobacteria bacterium]|nr:phosphoribosylanthranilate isomerase [Gammaproteobacteria bacterium]
MSPRIKICGITHVKDALSAAALGADAIGLIFYPKSPRFVTFEKARAIVQALPPFLTVVGVVVNPTTDELLLLRKEVPLDLIQFHGNETLEFCESLSFPYLKAFRVSTPNEVNFSKWEESHARGLLMDMGDSGESYVKCRKPLILAGGLTPETVGIAIQKLKPSAVDVCRGVERAPGVKDEKKLRAFVKAVKMASVFT